MFVVCIRVDEANVQLFNSVFCRCGTNRVLVSQRRREVCKVEEYSVLGYHRRIVFEVELCFLQFLYASDAVNEASALWFMWMAKT